MQKTIDRASSKEADQEILNRYGWAARTYAVLLAWKTGELTNEQATTLTGVSVFENDQHVDELIELANALWRRQVSTGTNLDDDLREAILQMYGEADPTTEYTPTNT